MNFMKKVLVLSDAYWGSRAGGIAMSLKNELDVFEAFVPAGIIIKLFRRLHNKPNVSSEGVHFYWCPRHGSLFYALYPLCSLFTLPLSLVRIFDRGVSCAYVHNTIQGLIYRLTRNSDYSFCYHASMSQEMEIDANAGKYGKGVWAVRCFIYLVSHLERFVLEGAAEIIVRSRFMEADLIMRYPNIERSKIHIIPLVGPEPAVHEDVGLLRRSIGVTEGEIFLLTIRRLTSRMGLENLLRATAKLVESGVPVKLAIGGHGHLRSALEALASTLGIADRVIFLGFITDEQKWNMYTAADLFIIPTEHYEGFGLVVLEAWAYSCPVVGTPVGALPEVLGAAGQEFICSGSSPDDIARGVWGVLPLVNDGRARSAVHRSYRNTYPRYETGKRVWSVIARTSTEVAL